ADAPVGEEGAITAKEEAPAAATQAAPRPAKTSRRVPEVDFTQGPPARVRMGFTKTGRLAYTGHLDLVRLLSRMLRRADLPLYYSVGFHPRPVLSFSPALSLGIASLGEYVDIKLDGDRFSETSEQVTARLQGASFDGLRVTGARVLGPHDRALNRIIDRATYVAGVPRSTLATLGLANAEDLGHLIDRRRAGDLKVRREVKGIGRTVDVGDYLLNATVDPADDTLQRAGLVGELVPIRYTLSLTGKGTAKPTEALEALLGTPEPLARIVRAGLFASLSDGCTHPLDLEPLRRNPSAKDAPPLAASAE
ncbi:MAG: TIGR03936 family radical SAM-associated protein, partial [Myxococcales bacterium]|nr:TIGR03936 family radical SAM-associated protein [Myxococcales bacterium]